MFCSFRMLERRMLEVQDVETSRCLTLSVLEAACLERILEMSKCDTG